jgi:dipeptidyl aminopeptidase/acylaminoacyl peptidase
VCYQIGMTETPPTHSTPFHDLDEFLALPRASGLAVSPDGSRVVTSITELNDKRTEFVSAIWELDPAGQQPARRLTRGAKGESSPAFTSDGDLLFVAARPTEEDDKPLASLWRLPAAGGEAAEALALPGGVTAVRAARSARATVVAAKLLRSASGVDEDKRLRALRKDNKVSAVLHSGYPVRYWDNDLGPDHPHLFDIDGARDLSPQPGDALREADFDVSPDGSFVVTSWHDPAPGASIRGTLVRIDVATAQRATIADDPEADLELPAISPDGTAVAFTRETHSTPDKAPRITLCHMRFGEPFVELTGEWDRWPTSVTWSADGSALIVTADDNGRGPIFAVDPSGGSVTRLTDDDYTYSDVRTAPEGIVYAMRSSYVTPPHPVRIDPDGSVTELPCMDRPALPGTLTEVTASARRRCCCGFTAARWQLERLALALEPVAARRPRLRRAAARPGAVHRLRPGLHPARLGRMGRRAVHRPHGGTDAAWRARTSTPTRTAAMGGSFGGYMANWIAGHTDRFRRDRHARQPVGARPVRADHRRRVLLAREMTPRWPNRTARTGTSTRSARRCWSSTATRTTACRSARRCGCGR